MSMGCDYLTESEHCNHKSYMWRLRKNKVNNSWECLYKDKKRCPLHSNLKWFLDLVKILRLLYPKNFWMEGFNKGENEIVRTIGYFNRGVTTQLMRSKNGKNYFVVQYCDGENRVDLPQEWGEAIFDVIEPNVQLKWL